MKEYFDLKKMPKVELHLHLDGSIRVSTLEEYAKKDIKQQVVAPDKCLNLGDYLTRFSLPVQYLQTKENIERACYELSQDLEDDGVIYAEVRFAPIKLTESGLSLEEVIKTVMNGFQKGNVLVSLILCMMRNDTYDTNIKIVNLAEKFLGKGVVALDLAGDEKRYPTSSFEKIFSIIKKKEIPFTIHAGEINDIDSLKSALHYGAKRLGHGINVIHYPELIDKIKEKQVLLEVCPTSNVQTNSIIDYYHHPIKKLQEKGCPISVSTDNRTVSNITLTEEYKRLMDIFHFTVEDFCKWNLDAINHCFLPENEKQKYRNIIQSYLSNK